MTGQKEGGTNMEAIEAKAAEVMRKPEAMCPKGCHVATFNPVEFFKHERDKTVNCFAERVRAFSLMMDNHLEASVDAARNHCGMLSHQLERYKKAVGCLRWQRNTERTPPDEPVRARRNARKGVAAAKLDRTQIRVATYRRHE